MLAGDAAATGEPAVLDEAAEVLAVLGSDCRTGRTTRPARPGPPWSPVPPGVGAAVTARLRADGFRVVTLDIEPGDGIDVVADVADPAGMSGVRAAVGPVDVLVNAADPWA